MSRIHRSLVVTADDFGMCDATNEGVALAHVAGIVTATSLMVRRAAAAAAAALTVDLPRLAVGLHLDLGEWEFRNDEWVQADFVVDVDDPVAVRDEIDRQLGAFVRLTGRTPTHLDGHQHVHLSEPARSIVLETGDALCIPVRHRDANYVGGFYGQTGTGEARPEWITPAALIAVLGSLSEGASELGCHPGRRMESTLSTYAGERDTELAALCDPDVRACIEQLGIELRAPCARQAL